MAKREKGEGSFYQRASDGLWVGVVDFGTTADGKRDRRSVTSKSRAVALAKWEALKRLSDAGNVAPAQMTVGDLLTRYEGHKRATLAPTSPRGYEAIELSIRKHLRPRLGHVKLAALTPAQVERMMAEIARDGRVRTALAARSVLRAALNWGMRERLVGRNAAAEAEPPAYRPKERRTLTAEEARRIMAAPHRFRSLWVVGFATALRMSELTGLRWEDVDLARGVLTVRQQTVRITGEGLTARATKTEGSAASVLLAPFAVAALREHQRQTGTIGGLVWRTRAGTPIGRENLHRIWTRLLGRLGVPHVNFHAATRHTCATLLLAAGVDLRIIQSVLRHARIATTSDIYTHVGVEGQAPAARALEELFGVATVAKL